MKTILSVIFILSSLFVCSQTPPKKGYYSIYNNKEKLISKENAISDLKKQGTPQIVNSPQVQKGYYSIRDNEKQTVPGPSTITSTPDTAPKRKPGPVSKGYYSIGTNNKKLTNR